MKVRLTLLPMSNWSTRTPSHAQVPHYPQYFYKRKTPPISTTESHWNVQQNRVGVIQAFTVVIKKYISNENQEESDKSSYIPSLVEHCTKDISFSGNQAHIILGSSWMFYKESYLAPSEEAYKWGYSPPSLEPNMMWDWFPLRPNSVSGAFHQWEGVGC